MLYHFAMPFEVNIQLWAFEHIWTVQSGIFLVSIFAPFSAQKSDLMNVPTGCVPSRNAQTVAIREAVQPLRALVKKVRE